jgi:hypothetical protein
MRVPRTALGGIVVFALGIALLLGVFFIAFVFFNNAANMLAQGESAAPNTLPPLSQKLYAGLLRLGFLLVMGYVSSLIAGKGIALFGVCREREEPKA